MPKQDLFQQKRIAQRRTIPRVTLVRVDATHSHMKGDWNIQLFSERKVRLKKRIAGCQSLGLSYNFSQHRIFSFHHKVPYPLHFVFARMAKKRPGMIRSGEAAFHFRTSSIGPLATARTSYSSKRVSVRSS